MIKDFFFLNWASLHLIHIRESVKKNEEVLNHTSVIVKVNRSVLSL